MKPKTAARTWRIKISLAASYIKHIEETDPVALKLQANGYRVKDVRPWARERIENILDEADALKVQFSDDVDLMLSAYSAVGEHVERLREMGFLK